MLGRLPPLPDINTTAFASYPQHLGESAPWTTDMQISCQPLQLDWLRAST